MPGDTEGQVNRNQVSQAMGEPGPGWTVPLQMAVLETLGDCAGPGWEGQGGGGIQPGLVAAHWGPSGI